MVCQGLSSVWLESVHKLYWWSVCPAHWDCICQMSIRRFHILGKARKLSIIVKFALSWQAQRVHRMCFTHSFAVLATSGVSDTQCCLSKFSIILHAYSTGCRFTNCWPPYCYSDWVSRAIKGKGLCVLSRDVLCIGRITFIFSKKKGGVKP